MMRRSKSNVSVLMSHQRTEGCAMMSHRKTKCNDEAYEDFGCDVRSCVPRSPREVL